MTHHETPQLWKGFDVSGPNGRDIPLRQIGPTKFHLGRVTIKFTGETGLEKYVARGDLCPRLHEQIRTIDETLLPETDLASVPGPLRWFTNTYGPHTPAALIHDYLIPDEGVDPIVAEEYADRYFRHMLGSVGVPRFKSFIMWAAVAMRTRFKSRKPGRRLMVALWALCSLVGLVTFGLTAADMAAGDGVVFGLNARPLFVASVIAPFAASILWGRQFGAGLVSALAAPWLIPATVVASAGYAVYWLLERLGSIIERATTARRFLFDS